MTEPRNLILGHDIVLAFNEVPDHLVNVAFGDALVWLAERIERTGEQPTPTWLREEAERTYQMVRSDVDEGDELECEGHESLSGAHMGVTVYCDGSCRDHERNQ